MAIKVMARREQARAAATAAVEKVNQDVKSVGDTAARNWSAVKAKIAADKDALQAAVAQAKHDLDGYRPPRRSGRASARTAYSITSSARSMIDGGMARPSAVAV